MQLSLFRSQAPEAFDTIISFYCNRIRKIDIPLDKLKDICYNLFG